MGETNYSDLLPAYVLGALEDAEARELERRLEESPELERELRQWMEQLENLADSSPAVTPSELARARVLKEVGNEAGTRTASSQQARPAWIPWAAAAALAALSVWLGAENARVRGENLRLAELAEDRDELAGQVELLRNDLERARLERRTLATAQRIVAAPKASVVLLAGLASAPEASANTYVDPAAGRAVFYASGLDPVADDKTYQLWFIGNEGPVSGGIFETDESGGATLLVDADVPPGQPLVWAVTIEPAGGVPQPTGEMVLKS